MMLDMMLDMRYWWFIVNLNEGKGKVREKTQEFNYKYLFVWS